MKALIIAVMVSATIATSVQADEKKGCAPEDVFTYVIAPNFDKVGTVRGPAEIVIDFKKPFEKHVTCDPERAKAIRDENQRAWDAAGKGIHGHILDVK